VEAVGSDLGEAQFEEAAAFYVAGAVEGYAEAGEGAEAAEMGDGALPGGEGGGAVVEDAFRGSEEDLVFAGDLEEEEALVNVHGHPAGLAREFFGVVPFFEQEAEEMVFPAGWLVQGFGQPATDVDGVGEFDRAKANAAFPETRHKVVGWVY